MTKPTNEELFDFSDVDSTTEMQLINEEITEQMLTQLEDAITWSFHPGEAIQMAMTKFDETFDCVPQYQVLMRLAIADMIAYGCTVNDVYQTVGELISEIEDD